MRLSKINSNMGSENPNTIIYIEENQAQAWKLLKQSESNKPTTYELIRKQNKRNLKIHYLLFGRRESQRKAHFVCFDTIFPATKQTTVSSASKLRI